MAPPIKSESDPGSISTGTVIKKESANERSAAVTKDPAAAKKDLAAVKKEPAAVKKGSATVIKSEPPTNGGPRASNQAVATSSKPKSQRENRFERRRMKRADDFTHQELRERYLIEQRARETFPGISIGEAVLKYIRGKPKPKAERKKCKAERKAERKAKRKAERERLATISEKPTGVSAGMAPIRQSNSWKHELVASQQQREEISRKLKDKYKDDLVEVSQ